MSIHHMVSESIVSVPSTLAEGSKRTLYQSLVDRSESPDFTTGGNLEGVSVSDLTYTWQMRKHFHEFCMQYDKYEPIDLPHFTQNPSLYDMLVWRNDKKKFQRILPSQIVGAFIQEGINEAIALGSVAEFDYDPSNSNLYPNPDANPADLNNDGSISTADLLEFLTVFGQVADDTAQPNPMIQTSAYKVTYADDDISNPPFDVDYYVVGANGGDGNLMNPNPIDFFSAANHNDELLVQSGFLSSSEADLDHVYDVGHIITVPTQAFHDIPLDGNITIDTSDFFGISNVAIARPNTQSIGSMQYDDLHQFRFTNIDKAGLFSNKNKKVVVEVDFIPTASAQDILHMAVRGTYTRYGPATSDQLQTSRLACTTWGGDPTVTSTGFGTLNFSDYQPEMDLTGSPNPIGNFSNLHKSELISPFPGGPNGEFLVQTIRAVVAAPLIQNLQPGESGYDSGGANAFLSSIYSASSEVEAPFNGFHSVENPANPDGVNFFGNKRVLKMLGGINATEDLRLSLGFYSQYGNLSSIKIKEVRFLFKP